MKVPKPIFDQMLQEEILDKEDVRSVLIDLYEKSVMGFEDIAIIKGRRGIHVVPPKWCMPSKNHMEPSLDDCHYNEQDQDRIKRLACVPMFVHNIKIFLHHDTGSSITLHSSKFRKKLSHKLKEKIKLVGQRRVNFKGIMGKKATIVADIYKWDLG